VYHFAAQVAVTTSLVDPFLDFEVNARGTLNLLEAVRACEDPPSVLFTSTNKVYGDLEDVGLQKSSTRYEPSDRALRRDGISEARCLEFHSPYGCSKGVAEQYVLDYARTFGLRTVVFRMSCIYGPHQFGTEDQGWVAHFLIAAMNGVPLTIYGDGLQVRDILFVEDLAEAMLLAQANVDLLAGEAFNIGGGPGNTTSLVELLDLMGELRRERPLAKVEPWRPADQRYYVSDTRKFERATGWRPKTGVREGVERLHEWLLDTRGSGRAATAGQVAS
jgi:CDP-paratose 2-epimerase